MNHDNVRPYSSKEINIIQEMQNPLMQANYQCIFLLRWEWSCVTGPKTENYVVYGVIINNCKEVGEIFLK